MKLIAFIVCLLPWLFYIQQISFVSMVRANFTIEQYYGLECNNSLDCGVENLTCSDNFCKCFDGFYIYNSTECLPYEPLGQNCTTDSNCTVPNSVCLNETCQCNSGFYQDSNLTMCHQHEPLGQNCTTDSNCTVPNSVCLNETCQCNSGYYQDSNLTLCHQLNGLFEFCLNSKQCFGDNETKCINNKCLCNDEYYYENGTCLAKHGLFESCNHTQECLGMNVVCINSNCSCNDQSYYKNDKCQGKHRLFEACNSTQECSGLNVECIQNNCSCNDKDYEDNGNCYPKKPIGETCTTNHMCSDPHAVCQYNKCQCDSEYFFDKICYPKKKLFEVCHKNNECLNEETTRCFSNNCTCKDSYYEQNRTCLMREDYDSKCSSNKMCSLVLECKDNRCKCKKDYYLDPNKKCYKKVGHGIVCQTGGCLGENTICVQKCKCRDGYKYSNSICTKQTSTTVIILVVLLISILLCVSAYTLWKIKKQKSDDFKIKNKVTQVELDIPRSRPIVMSKFPETVDSMHQDNNKIFNDYFLDLGKINPLILTENSDLRSETTKYLPCHEATKMGNGSKNRFLDILPFDHSRVKLKPIDDDAASDYINANYISGYSREKEYIAAQGPLSNTSCDFWRMVWQEKVSIIVMLTLCREKEMSKCDNYWPLEKGSKLDYDDITIETTNVTHYDSYDYRSMRLQIDETTRSLKHFHFLQWADFSANVPVEILIDFVRNVRSHITSNTPIVVHCSAGVGRTGTFIAVDYMLQFVDANPLDSKIDIFKFVSKMRMNRVHMVQNKNQYILIHDCIKYAVKKKMAIENGDPDYANEVNLYENQGFVTIDLTEKETDSKPQSSVSVEMIEEVEEEEEEEEEERGREEEEKEEEEEENPYENEFQDLSKAEKDYLNDPDSDENPYDVPENAMLIDKTNDEKQLDESNPNQDVKPVILEVEDPEEENPYENEKFAETEEKQVLTSL